MRETKIEAKLIQAVRLRGGICPKLVCPGYSGMPDRIALLPGGKLAFIEVKAPVRTVAVVQSGQATPPPTKIVETASLRLHRQRRLLQ